MSINFDREKYGLLKVDDLQRSNYLKKCIFYKIQNSQPYTTIRHKLILGCPRLGTTRPCKAVKGIKIAAWMDIISNYRLSLSAFEYHFKIFPQHLMLYLLKNKFSFRKLTKWHAKELTHLVAVTYLQDSHPEIPCWEHLLPFRHVS